MSLRPAIENWKNLRILVVGDLILDHYVWGAVHRVSPEAPIPVLKVSGESVRAGGAANVALNLSELGTSVVIAGFTGNDANGARLRDILKDANITDGALTVPGLITTCKTRVIGGHQQIVRLDQEQIHEPSAAQLQELIQFCAAQLQSVDALVISDYAKGVCSKAFCEALIQASVAAQVPVLVDPKGHDFSKYRQATLLCPNLAELGAVLRSGDMPPETMLERGLELMRTLELQYLVVSMSEHGLAVLDGSSILKFPAVLARSVFDVSGAGDTVISMLAACFAGGLDMAIAARLSNVAAGIVVGKVGTAPITKTELLAALQETEMKQMSDKIAGLDTLSSTVQRWRENGDSIIFANGCFDLLHVGHLSLLEQAKNEGGRLIVAINNDASVKRLKGYTRPVLGERDRARMLAALECVDAVLIFEEDTPLAAIKALQPDVLVKGGDYTEEQIVGAEEVKSWNGRVKIFPLIHHISTSEIISRAMAMR